MMDTNGNFLFPVLTRRHQIADFLRDQILNGQMKPGEKLREVDLSRKLGVSRGPLREALRELHSDGLVVTKPYVGTSVAEYSQQDFTETYAVRGVLEKKAFELLWARRDAGYEKEFTARHEKIIRAIDAADLPAIISAEMSFHSFPYEYSGNQLLLSIWGQLARRTRLTFMLHCDAFGSLDNYRSAHLSYLECALGKDLTLMQREVDNHLELGEVLIKKMIRSHKNRKRK